MDWNWVTNRIAIGSEPSRADIPSMLRQGITDVLDLRGEPHQGETGPHPEMYEGTGIRYHYVGMLDRGGPQPAEKYVDGVQTIYDALADPNDKVLVHCFPPGTILDAPIPVPIEHVGAVVMGHDGKEHFVTERMNREFSGDLVTICATGMLPIRCTPEHHIYVLKPYRTPDGRVYKPNWDQMTSAAHGAHNDSMRPQWVEAGDVEEGDFLLYPLPKQSGDAPIPVPFPVYSEHGNSKTIERALFPSVDVAWMLGFYAADGSCDDYSIHFTLSVRDDLERLERSLRTIGVEPVVKRHPTYVRVHAASRTLARSFGAWFGLESQKKRLPSFVFDGWDTRAVLEGLVDGDGYESKGNGWVLSSTSLTLIFQARRLALLAGMSPTVREFHRRSGYANAVQMYQLEARESKQHQTCRWQDYYCMPIRSVARTPYEGVVYNLEVADVNTYIANGAIVHNCAAGVSRSPSMVYAYLRSAGMSDADAWYLIRTHRTVASRQYFDSVNRALPMLPHKAAGGSADALTLGGLVAFGTYLFLRKR